MKTFFRCIQLLTVSALAWGFSGRASAQIISPLEVSFSDSSTSHFLCAQPWNYNPTIYANGNNSSVNIDAVEFYVDWGDGQQQTFNIPSVNQNPYFWASTSPSHTYTTAGIYTLTIIATSYAGGVAQDHDTIYAPGYLVINTCDQFDGYVFLDSDNGCTNNAGDYGAPYTQIEITDAGSNVVAYTYTDPTGYFSVPLPTGATYTATIGWPFGGSAFNCTSGPSHTFTLSGSPQSHDFAMTYNASGFDLAVINGNAIVALNGARWLSFNISELMSITPQVANVTVNVPAGLTPTYSNNTYTFAGGTMTFDPIVITPFSGPSGGAYWNSYFWNYFSVDTSIVHIGDVVCFTINVDPTVGDANTASNTFNVCATVLNSYDPNNKLVSPAGLGTNGAIPPGQTALKYTVNFQNTGNAPAANIDIVDTLDSDLDLSSFHLESTSHPCEVIANGNIMTFRFSGINLPDSTSDEPGSHGFVKYSINVPASAALGTEFTNTAYIYFDFNPPIVTNTTINTIAQVSVEGNDGELYNLSFFPNPATDMINIRLDKPVDGTILLTDMNGRILAEQNLNAQLTQMSLNGISRGMYILEVRTGQFSEKHKLIVR